MYLISAEGYKKAKVNFLKIKKTDKSLVSMKNLRNGLSVKNKSHLVLKKLITNMKEITL